MLIIGKRAIIFRNWVKKGGRYQQKTKKKGRKGKRKDRKKEKWRKGDRRGEKKKGGKKKEEKSKRKCSTEKEFPSLHTERVIKRMKRGLSMSG